MESIFYGRSFYSFEDKEVDERVLLKIYDLMKLGPTSFNGCPIRILFLLSDLEKEKLIECLSDGNKAPTKQAPVVAIISYDLKFYEKLDILFPMIKAQELFKKDPALAEVTAFRNGTLQAGYFILAARSLGLDVGPMSGFDEKKVQELFLKDTTHKINFICNIGYGKKNEVKERLPRLDFYESCKII